MVQFPNPIVDELTVNAAANPFTYIRIYDNGSLGLPIIEFASSIGRTFKLVSLHQLDLAIFADNLPTNIVQYFVQDEGIAFVPGTSTTSGIVIDYPDGWLKAGTYDPGPPLVFTPEDWHTVTLSGAWAGVVQYKMLPTGEVIWRGSCAGGSTVVGDPICTVPAGYRPALVCRFETPVGGLGAGGRVQINTAGACVIAETPSISSVWFDTVRYSTI